MKPLLVTRLFSHLEPMLRQDDWQPRGMPAVCKLLEGLSRRRITADIALLDKQVSPTLRVPLVREFKQLPGLTFHAVPLPVPMGGRVAQLRNAAGQFGYVSRLLRRGRHDVIYCDRAHLGFGAVMAWWGRRVVLRLHGLASLPETTALLEKRGLPSLRLRSLGAPFRHIVGTREGSDYAAFGKGRFAPSVPLSLLLNGVDKPCVADAQKDELRRELGLAAEVPVVLMSGRMDDDKNPLQLFTALSQLKARGMPFYGLFVGGGGREEELRRRAAAEGMEDRVRVCGQVAHNRMPVYAALADVYVSLNAFGNLSNVVLEAMQAGRCIVTFAPCAATGRDEQNNEPELRDAQVLIDRTLMERGLPDALAALLAAPDTIREKERRMRAWADANLRTWEERIDWEIDLLERIASGQERHGGV